MLYQNFLSLPCSFEIHIDGNIVSALSMEPCLLTCLLSIVGLYLVIYTVRLVAVF